MRTLFALLIILFGNLSSLAVAQSEFPPPPRLVRRYPLDLPSPSRPIGPAKFPQIEPPAEVEFVQYSEPVLAPPAEEPARLPERVAPAEIQNTSPAKFPEIPAKPIAEPGKTTTPPQLLQSETSTPETAPVRSPYYRQESSQSNQPQTFVVSEKDSTPTSWKPTSSQKKMAPPPPESPDTAEKQNEYSPPSGHMPVPHDSLPVLDTQTQLSWPEIDPYSPEIYSGSDAVAFNEDCNVFSQYHTPYENIDPFASQQPYSNQCQCPECTAQRFGYNEIAPLYSFGLKGGSDRSILDLRALLPLWQSDTDLLFGEIRGRFDDHEANEGQFGIGLRSMINEDWLVGLYTYYDLRKTTQRNRFNQFTAGLEVMSVEWDFRVNSYFPNEGAKPSGLNQGISNGTIVSNAFQERAYRGFNAEIGKRLFHWGRYDTSEIRGFAGYYSFDSDATGFRSIDGPAARIEYRCYDLAWFGDQSRFTTGFEYTNDNVRDEQYWAYFRVQIPFAPKTNRKQLSTLRRRMIDLPARNID